MEVIPGRVTIEVLEGQYENLTRTGKENHIEGTGYPVKMGEAGDIKPKAIVYVEGVKLGDTSVKPDKVVILTEYARIGE